MKHESRIFPNGLKLVVNQTQEHSLCVLFHLNFGVEDEKKKNEGISTIIQNLLYYGTEANPSKNSLISRVQSFGGILDINASFDYFDVSIECLTSAFSDAVDVLSDIVFSSLFKNSDLEACKEIVKNRIDQEHFDPTLLCHDKLRAIMFPTCGLGRDICGRKISVDKVTRQDVCDFWADGLNPKNAIISVVGDVEIGFAYDLVMQKIYPKFLQCSGRNIKPAKTENPLAIVKFEKLSSKKLYQSRVQLGFYCNPYKNSLNHNSILLGADILQSEINNSFSNEAGFYGVTCKVRSFTNNGMFYMDFASEPENIIQFTSRLSKCISKIITEGLDDDSYKSIKAQYQTRYVTAVEQTKVLASFSARHWQRRGSPFSIRDELLAIASINAKKCFVELANVLKQKPFVSYVGKVSAVKPNEIATAFSKNILFN